MIKLENIYAGYNKVEIIKNINMTFEEGSITSIIGKMAVETTLLRTASNLLKPFRGHIIIDDKDIRDYQNKGWQRRFPLPQLRAVANITV